LVSGAKPVFVSSDSSGVRAMAASFPDLAGIMFFKNVAMVMGEMLRVLRPSGRVALLAWGLFEQPFFDATVGVVMQQVFGTQLRPPPALAQVLRFPAHRVREKTGVTMRSRIVLP